MYTGWRTWPHSESSQISGGADGDPFQISLIEPPEVIPISPVDETPEVIIAAVDKFEDVEPQIDPIKPKVIYPYVADFENDDKTLTFTSSRTVQIGIFDREYYDVPLTFWVLLALLLITMFVMFIIIIRLIRRDEGGPRVIVKERLPRNEI